MTTSASLAQRIKESDLLIAIGARLGEMTTSGYTLIDIPMPAETSTGNEGPCTRPRAYLGP